MTRLIPIQYNRKEGIGKPLDISVCLSASDWRGLNRNQTQTAVLEIEDSQTEGERNMTQTNEVTYECKPFNYVSLFSGIGGFETALNRLGGTCVLASEIDKFANQSYAALYGEPTAGDITQIQAEDVPDHDVLVGGFPCPSFSVAGKRDGMEYECNDCGHEHLITFNEYKNGVSCPQCGGDTEPKDIRGLLFFEIARLADAKQPKAVLMENVKGLISSGGGEVMRIITQTMSEIGFTVDFEVLNSKYFGVPQNRERVFIIAIRDDLVSQQPWDILGTNVVAKGKRRISEIEGVKTFNFDFPEQTEVSTRLRDILESTVDERYYLSEEKTEKLVAQLDEGLAVKEATKQGYAMAAVGDAVNFQFPDSNTRRGRVGKQIANTLEASNINQGVVEAQVKSVGNVNPSGNGMNGQVYDVDAGLSPTLTTNKGEGVKMFEEVRPVLTPDRVEKRQNGRRFKDNDEESFTLTSIDRHGVAIGEQPKYRIRKLTPLECWRLQGFTDEQHQTVVDAGLSDSQRYKQAGNAVTVNVIQAIGERLLTYI